MEGVTVDLLLKHYSLSGEVLEEECTSEHIREISLFLESWELLAPSLGLKKEQVEAIKRNAVSEEEKRIMVLEKWKESFIFLATYQKLIEAFLAIHRADLARKVCELLTKKSPTGAWKLKLPSEHEQLFLLRLKDILIPLRQLKDTPSKATIIEEAVMDFVDQSMSQQSSEHVIEQLQKLHHEDMLISKELLQKAQKMVAKLKHEKQNSILPATSDKEASAALKSDELLFSKGTLYHASLCIRAVNVCDAGNYQKFFNGNMKDEPVPGHSFRAVSISRSKQEHFKFLIAQKDENTFYFAFQGVKNLSEWDKHYSSFNEGVLGQSGYFPIRFIVELLNKQCRIVLTGFSFGGLLACTIAAQVWDTPFIHSGLLQENMACVAFGLPYVTSSVIQTVVRRRPEIVSTLHAVYLEDDPVPQLMSFLDKSWSVEALRQSDDSKLGLTHMDYQMPFQDSTTSNLLKMLVKLQAPPDAAILPELKSKLSEVHHLLESSFKSLLPTTTSYLLSRKETIGLTWSEMTVEQANAFRLLSQQKIMDLDTTMFQKHCELQYSRSLFEGYLDKPARYKPSKPMGVLGEVENFKPHVDEVQVHAYGNETAVVLEGSNLWFCYHVSFGGHLMKIPAKDITGSSIQFNAQEVLKLDGEEGIQRGKVVLNSHLSKIIKQEVPFYEKRFNITTKQGQLAKLTPSQVIELGYLSALLEQHPYSKSQPLSHKVAVIQKFLEDIGKVVPFESIAYAIAYGSYNTAVVCGETLLSIKKTEIPITETMQTGLNYAIHRCRYGYPGQLFEKVAGYFTTSNREYRVDVDDQQITCSRQLSFAEQQLGAQTPKRPVKRTLDLKQYKSLMGPTNIVMADRLWELSDSTIEPNLTKAICQRDLSCFCSQLTIDVLYPVHEDVTDKKRLKSPLNILVSGRVKLADLTKKLQFEQEGHTSTCSSAQYNRQMLDDVNSIRNNELNTCTSLLGSFMYQYIFSIQLAKSHKHVQELWLNAMASVGVWALFSLDYTHVQSILSKCQGEQLLIRILDHIKSIAGIESADDSGDNPYAAKLQFIVQGMSKTVTCNTQLVSYSLERQLVDICKKRKILAETSVNELTSKWSKLFEQTVLSLVVPFQRRTIAQWLKWALMIHNLREELAKYTAVGVAGLVNSGKSKLVSNLFGIKIPTGTTETKRTTVPFIYNLDEEVEGLDVVDFPGVDDEDDTIGELANLLLTIAQILLFVVDYKRVNTQSCKKWLERLRKENVPVLVCLTFGDRLYAEHMSDDGEHPSKEFMTHVIEEQQSVNTKKLGISNVPYFQEMKLFSFSQEKDSVLNNKEGRQRLRNVGIGTPQDVGEWLVNVFRKRFQGQEELANQLEPFFKKNVQDS